MTDDQYHELRVFLGERLSAIDQRFDAIDHRFDAIETQVIDARRHFGVLAEDFQRQVAVVAEGVAGTNERLDRHRDEVDRQFADLKVLIHSGYTDLDRRVRKLEGRRRRRPK